MDHNEQEKRKTMWSKLLLVASLAFNVFGVSWYVTHGYMDSNLPIAQALRELKSQPSKNDFSEVQMIESISRELSDDGARIIFQEYALRKPKLDRLINQLDSLQIELKQEISRTVMREKILKQNLAQTSDVMSQRFNIMTQLVESALTKLSDEDRKKIISKK